MIEGNKQSCSRHFSDIPRVWPNSHNACFCQHMTFLTKFYSINPVHLNKSLYYMHFDQI